jgi:putative DNA primase/helicase
VPRIRRGNGYRSGDDFNHRANWHHILEPYGWVSVQQHGDVTYWRRPGKDVGMSATTNYAGTGLLYIFSTNAAPLEANTAYTSFVAYTLLVYSGDFVKAARVLHEQGYGIQYLHGLRTIHAWPLALRTVAAEEVTPWR